MIGGGGEPEASVEGLNVPRQGDWCIRWTGRVGVRRRKGQRGPSYKTSFRLFVRTGYIWFTWWPDGKVRPSSFYRYSASGGYERVPSWCAEDRTMKRVKLSKPEEGPNHHASLDPGRLPDLPGLHHHCAIIKYDDGEPRKPGAVRFWVEGAEWCVRVSDPDSSSSFVARGPTLSDALLTAELLITSDTCPWSPDSFLQEQAAKKKRK